MDNEIQQIREHEFQRGYQEAEEKYQQIYEGGCLHDSLVDQACTIEQQAQEIARLREALEIYREASFQSHNGHWDMTMQHGAGCPECIRVRELRAKADHIVAQQALKDSQTSK